MTPAVACRGSWMPGQTRFLDARGMENPQNFLSSFDFYKKNNFHSFRNISDDLFSHLAYRNFRIFTRIFQHLSKVFQRPFLVIFQKHFTKTGPLDAPRLDARWRLSHLPTFFNENWVVVCPHAGCPRGLRTVRTPLHATDDPLEPLPVLKPMTTQCWQLKNYFGYFCIKLEFFAHRMNAI